MFVKKNNFCDSALKSFLNKGLCEHFGVDIFSKFFMECEYSTNRNQLVIHTQNTESANFINSSLAQEVENFCNIVWSGYNIKPIAYSINQDFPADKINGYIDNVISLDDHRIHSFNDFIVSKENKIAYDSLCSIAGKNQKMFQNGSLLYITGDVGVGKTHLLRASEDYISRNKTKNSCYLSAEVFGSKYVTSVKDNSLFDLRNTIIANDILLIDDIGFIAHRKSTIEELSSIISVMLDNGKNVVIASSSNVSHFKDAKRLYNRLLSAAVINIPQAGSDLKAKLCEHLSNKYNLSLNREVIDFLANNLTGGAREIKGALDRIRLNIQDSTQVSVFAAKTLLSDLIIPEEITIKYANNVEMVIDVVSNYYSIDKNIILNNRTTKSNKIARLAAIYLCREVCSLVYADIARYFGFSVHSSVLHAITNFKNKMLEDQQIKYDLDIIMDAIRKNII